MDTLLINMRSNNTISMYVAEIIMEVCSIVIIMEVLIRYVTLHYGRAKKH